MTKCIHCGEEIENKNYYADILGGHYQVAPGFDDIFVLCEKCYHSNLDQLIKREKFNLDQLIHVKNGTLKMNWKQFFKLRNDFKRREIPEIDEAYCDLVNLLVYLGFLTYNPNGSWMFVESYYNIPSLYYDTIFGCLFFKTKEEIKNFWKVKKVKGYEEYQEKPQVFHLVGLSRI
ncbi:hypothetical protein M0R01_02510 [bacterium]|nr:hypothetical protein [bacterium]